MAAERRRSRLNDAAGETTGTLTVQSTTRSRRCDQCGQLSTTDTRAKEAPKIGQPLNKPTKLQDHLATRST